MKLFLTVLLVLSCNYLTIAQDLSLFSLGLVENSPFLSELVNQGAQKVLGQLFDSGLVNDLDSFDGQLNKLYSVSETNDADLINIISEGQFGIQDGRTFLGRWTASWVPSTNFRQFTQWSFALLGTNPDVISGTNVSWLNSTNDVVVRNFEGIEQWSDYLRGDLNATQTLDFQQFLIDNAGYTRVDPDAEGPENPAIGNSYNIGLSAILEEGGIADAQVENVLTLHNRVADQRTFWRTNANVRGSSEAAEVVWVVLCDTDSDCTNGQLQYWYFNSLQDL